MDDNLLERLKPICLAEDEETRYPALYAPFFYVRDGVRYLCATDGRVAVFVASEIEAPPAPVDFDVIFAAYQPSPLRVNTAKLFEYTGPPQYEWRCNCPDCYEPHCPEVRRGFINQVLCDLNLLARGISVVPVEECEISLPAEYVEKQEKAKYATQMPPVFFRGSNWWISLMPMRLNADAEDYPHLDL